MNIDYVMNIIIALVNFLIAIVFAVKYPHTSAFLPNLILGFVISGIVLAQVVVKSINEKS